MRAWLLIPMMLLPLTGCMTQRDATVWAEFKAEISGSKSTPVEKKADADDDAEAVQFPTK